MTDRPSAPRPAARPPIHDPAHDPAWAGARGRCPRCGSGRLFETFLAPAPECEACGLDFGFADTGDAAAVPVILVVGFLVVGLALWAEASLGIPLWLHFALWPLLTLAITPPLTRAAKGAFIGQQYRTRAAEGRLGPRGEGDAP